jgi:hypothetical protein
MSQAQAVVVFDQPGRDYAGFIESDSTGSRPPPPVELKRPRIQEDVTGYPYYEEDIDPIGTINLLDFLEALRSGPSLSHEIYTYLDQRLVTEFSDIEAVDAVYTEHYRGKVVITVLLSNAAYDELLMDELLDREFDIQEEMSNLVMDFRYIPLLGRRRDECVSPPAEPIFESR